VQGLKGKNFSWKRGFLQFSEGSQLNFLSQQDPWRLLSLTRSVKKAAQGPGFFSAMFSAPRSGQNLRRDIQPHPGAFLFSED
jgi:hypothetical protein